MSKRADMDMLAGSFVVPKGGEPAAPDQPEDGPVSKAYAHTLSLRLTADQYRRLRRYVAASEDRHGRRITHQAIIEAALADYLSKHGG